MGIAAYNLLEGHLLSNLHTVYNLLLNVCNTMKIYHSISISLNYKIWELTTATIAYVNHSNTRIVR